MVLYIYISVFITPNTFQQYGLFLIIVYTLHLPVVFVCRVLYNLYDSEGWCWPMAGTIQATVRSPVRLVWDIPEELSHRLLQEIIPANVKVSKLG